MSEPLPHALAAWHLLGMPAGPFLTRVVLKDYKSIGACDVALGPLTFLVGPNGAGKSNFLDALAFVRDALASTLEFAFRERGGFAEVRRRSATTGRALHIGIRLEFTMRDGKRGQYQFRIADAADGGYGVIAEDCRSGNAMFHVSSGSVQSNVENMPRQAAPDRLFLVQASHWPEFRAVHDALTAMALYNLSPSAIREPQPADPGMALLRDGRNLASVLARLARERPEAAHLVTEYLAKILPGLEGVERTSIGTKETIQIVQGAEKRKLRFPATGLSDGTLRALGVLVALFQADDSGRLPLVAIEEPELALHPAAAGVLREALRDAADSVQVLVTSHSPDLLDDRSIDADALLAVVARDGRTHIARLDSAGRTALRDHLYTAGELLRLDQLFPDFEETERAANEQGKLFDGEAAQ